MGCDSCDSHFDGRHDRRTDFNPKVNYGNIGKTLHGSWEIPGTPSPVYDKYLRVVPPVDSELERLLISKTGSSATSDPYEESMMLLRFAVYDLITKHVPDQASAYNLKKLVHFNFH